MSISKHKQLIIHAITEIIILGIFTFYVSRKNKILTGYIKELSLKIDEQELKIKQHEQLISSVMETINNIKEKIFHQDKSITELSFSKSHHSEQSPPRKSQNRKEEVFQKPSRQKQVKKSNVDISSEPLVVPTVERVYGKTVTEQNVSVTGKRNLQKNDKIKQNFKSYGNKSIVIEEILSDEDEENNVIEIPVSDDESLDIDIQEELEELEEIEELED